MMCVKSGEAHWGAPHITCSLCQALEIAFEESVGRLLSRNAQVTATTAHLLLIWVNRVIQLKFNNCSDAVLIWRYDELCNAPDNTTNRFL